MFRKLCISSILAFVIFGAGATITEDEDVKIVGGTSAKEGEFPYQVSLRSKNRHFCGGSILNERWILTAAHCLSGFGNNSITVYVGTNTLDDGGDSYQSLRLVVHPNYSDLLIRDDIGLIEVEKPIVCTDNVKPISLPNEDFNKNDSTAVLSGWGTTSYPGKTPNELQHITLSVIDQNECLNTSFRVTNSNICTLNKKGEGACHVLDLYFTVESEIKYYMQHRNKTDYSLRLTAFENFVRGVNSPSGIIFGFIPLLHNGDSGGPLVAENVQIGIVSWGTPCARGRPDVFTRVFSYIDWIKKYI